MQRHPVQFSEGILVGSLGVGLILLIALLISVVYPQRVAQKAAEFDQVFAAPVQESLPTTTKDTSKVVYMSQILHDKASYKAIASLDSQIGIKAIIAAPQDSQEQSYCSPQKPTKLFILKQQNQIHLAQDLALDDSDCINLLAWENPWTIRYSITHFEGIVTTVDTFDLNINTGSAILINE